MAKFRRDLPPIHNPHITGANWAELYDPAPARIPDFHKERLVHVKMWDLGRGCTGSVPLGGSDLPAVAAP